MWAEKLKNGKVRYCERYYDLLTGKEKKVSVTMDKETPRNTKLAAATLQSKIDSALHPEAPEGTTLEMLVEYYRKDQQRTVKASTSKRNYFACETLMNILGRDVLVDKLNAGYIRSRLLATDKDPGTLNEHIKRLKALIRWGYRNDFLEDIRWLDKLDLLKDISHREKIKDKYLEGDELRTLLDAMESPRWKNLTHFLALSGLRFGEAVALTNKDVDFENNVIIVNKTYDIVNEEITTPKTLCSIREVYMQEELRRLCRKIRTDNLRFRNVTKYRNNDLFLEGPDGNFIKYYTYNKYLRENSMSAIGRPITAHVLRHTHASILMEKGVEVDTISRRLGHENSKVTKEIYLHVTEQLKKIDRERIANVNII